MHKIKQRAIYIIFDILAVIITWTFFYIFRKEYIEYSEPEYDWQFTSLFYITIVVLPIFWVILHFLTGYYKILFRKSLSEELSQTLNSTFIGVTFLFFAILLDDKVIDYYQYYYLYICLFILQFLTTYLFRLTITQITRTIIKKNKIEFNTIIIGDSNNAFNIINEIKNQKQKLGLNIIGFVYDEKKETYFLANYLKNLGSIKNINSIISKNKVENIIIAFESNNSFKIRNILYVLQGINVDINIVPDLYDVFSGKVKKSAIFGIPFIEIKHNNMPIWQQYIKIIFDFCTSFIALLILSPLIVLISILVKITSKGPVFFKQERVGQKGKIFKIIKFRTMYIDAEKRGPQLSNNNDDRITKLGKFLRKSRIDEIPQFLNVLKGEMSMVGPRPERQYYVDQILKRAPYYQSILSIKPGISGWGQIRNGYCSNIDDMINRLRYDLLYLENRSIYLDFKILFYTVIVVLKKEGV
ncbi:MAG: sugar transferase [Bacteroidales bacterium]|jgi:exopolysaccharide biosynthesis polyprenyl glycosylphosphotransferase|nr:sugar transferase [Bacteroidales bacterium]